MNKKLLKDAVTAMYDVHPGDTEMAHGEAEDILLEYLRASGAKELADAWDDLIEAVGGFWYA